MEYWHRFKSNLTALFYTDDAWERQRLVFISGYWIDRDTCLFYKTYNDALSNANGLKVQND